MKKKSVKKSLSLTSKIGSEQFAFVAAHQLKTPLTALRWYTGELLKDQKEMTSQQQETVREIRLTLEQMSEMLNALLRIGRIRSGRLTVEPVPLDILSVTKEAILNLDKQILHKDVEVSVKSVPSTLPLVPMDKDILRHVLQNLLENAVRYSQKKGKVSVIVKQTDGHLQFAVKDQGIGIPENEQKEIFKEFFRARNAAQFQPRGTGLGLSLVKYLVNHWKGKIWFTSHLGKGTTFFFTIPVKGVKAQKGEVSLSA